MMAAYTHTGCFTHPDQIDRSYNCIVCSAILMTGTTDFTNSVYPEINANKLAGPAPYFALQKSHASINPFKSFAGRTVLNTFTISTHFHPGQHAEELSNYSERFALSEDEQENRAPKRQQAPSGRPRGRPRKIQAARSKRVEQPTSPQPVSVQPPTPRRRIVSKPIVSAQELEELVERRVAERLQAALSATITTRPQRRTRQHKSSEAKARVLEEDSELEGDTIVVEESDDEEPIRIQRKRKRSSGAAKDDSSDEETFPAARSSTKRTRFIFESPGEENPAKKTRSSKRDRQSKR